MPVLYLLSILFAVLLGWISHSAAVGFSLVFFLFLGILICWLFTRKTGTFNDALKLFYTLFLIYFFYSLVNYLDYTLTGGFFLYPDQGHFYGEALTLSKNNSLDAIFHKVFIKRIYSEQPLAYFIFGSIGYLAENYFGGQNVMLQSVFVAFPAILINLFLYKLLLIYIDDRKALRYTFLFGLLSGVFYFSPWILRDIHMALLFIAGIYIIHTPFSYFRLALLIICNLLAIELRLEHGLFYLFIPFLYIYFQGKQHRFIRIFYVPIILVVFTVFTFLLLYLMPQIQTALLSLENYREYTTERLGGGLATSLYYLPQGIKQVAIILYSQISPFPPWTILQNATTSYQVIVGIVSLVTSVFWGVVFIFLLLSVPAAKRNLQLPSNLLVLLAFTILFFIANTANMSERRIMSMYPVVFIAFAQIKSSLPVRVQTGILKQALFVYSLLVITYLVLKYML